MYCTNCGNNIDDQARYCPHCGQETGSQNNDPECVIFDPVACARELDSILAPLEDLENSYEKMLLYDKAAQKAGQDTKLMVYGFSIGGGAVLSFGIVQLLSISSSIVFFLLWAAITGAAIAGSKNFVAQRTVQEKEEMEASRESFTEKYNSCFIVVYPVLCAYIPEDYRYSYAVQTISSYFHNLRADNMKEAINLFEEELHRLRLENMAELTLVETQKQTTLQMIQVFELANIGDQLSSISRRI